MKPLFQSFSIFLYQIARDSMLFVICLAPLLTALFFHYGIPYIEQLLCVYFQQSTVLTNYYLLFDLLLSIITPSMFCFVSAMVMLTEHDENMTGYIAVTPIEKKGYCISRLIIPGVISFFISVLFILLFSLTQWSLMMILVICQLTSVQSIITALIIFSFSHNRVEGMALGKLSGLFMVGLDIPFFLMSDVQYLFSFLPSFWIAKIAIEQDYMLVIPAIMISFLWAWLLYRKFIQKLM